MRKIVVLLLVFIMFISAALVMHWKIEESKNQFTAIKKNMGEYKYDKGTLGIAIARTMKSKAVIHNFGKPIYPVDRNLQYVWVYIKIVNKGTKAVQVEPEEFTLSIPGKDAVNYDIKATNSMQKCLKSANLNPDKQDIGVLIFALPESNDYILYYNGPKVKVEKRLVIDSP